MSDDPTCVHCGHLLSSHHYGEAACSADYGERSKGKTCGCRDFSSELSWSEERDRDKAAAEIIDIAWRVAAHLSPELKQAIEKYDRMPPVTGFTRPLPQD